MKIKISKSPEIIFSISALLIITLSFLAYLVINYIYLRQSAYNEIQNFLKNANNRIISDLVYKDNQWNTSGYINDDQTIQDKPLYIITSDGFIIDRVKPISGFLDTSDFKFSSSFQSPQTITTPVNEEWRLYSANIKNDGDILGTVIVGYYQPEATAIKDIDNQLISTANDILSEIKLSGNKIDTSNIDIKKISIKLSVGIVDKFNHALISVGGIPGYIDRSYVSNELEERFQTIVDKKTGEPFLVYSKPVYDSKNLIGVVISGYSLKQVNTDLRNQLIFLTISGLTIIIIISILMIFVFQRQLVHLVRKPQEFITEESKNNQNKILSRKILEVNQKMDGTVTIHFQGKEYKASKPELYSDSDQFIERLMELTQSDLKEIEYDILKDSKISLSTPLSKIVTRLGFVGLKRKLFFPRTSKQRVLFRRFLTQEDLDNMGLTNEEIASELTKTI
jgi:hypothetical protein